jgi:hypothetical protein
MSYNTDYSLEISRSDGGYLDDDQLDDIENAMPGYGGLVHGETTNCKWYGHEEDMRDLSMQFPDVVFVLEGIGAEFPDMWRKRFYNGEVEEVRPEISWPEFTTI